MGRILLVILYLLAAVSAAVGQKREVRAAWLSTRDGLDWPCGTVTEDEQKKQLSDLIEKLHDLNINTVLFQAETDGAVAWISDIQPAMHSITGDGNRPLAWNVCQFVIDQCHDRGMECHAWVAGYRLGPQHEVSVYSGNQIKHPAESRRELCKMYNGEYYLNPGLPETADYLTALYRELLAGYDFDGINLDNMAYPGSDFDDVDTYREHNPDGLPRSDWRRDNINRLIAAIHDMAVEVNPMIKVGATTAGTYKNSPGYGNPTAYGSYFQDAGQWSQSGNLDMVFPKMFWDESFGFSDNMEQWISAASGNSQIVAGISPALMTSDNWPVTAVTGQIEKIRDRERLAGICFFSAGDLVGDNPKSKELHDRLLTGYFRYPAHLPVFDNGTMTCPQPPENVTTEYYDGKHIISWNAPPDDTPVKYYTVYLKNGTTGYTDEPGNEIAHMVTGTEFEYTSGESGLEFAVTAFNPCYMESPPAESLAAGNTELDRSVTFIYTAGIITIYSGIPLEYVNIYTSTGNLIHHIEASGCDMTISCDGMSGGMYIAEVVQNDGSRNVYKFVR